jgi:hypothetical protein
MAPATLVDAVKRDMSSADARGNDDELDRLAEVTGGIADYVAATSNIEHVAQEMAHRIRNEYTIAYTPANQVLDGSYRAVRVTRASCGRVAFFVAATTDALTVR